MVNEKRSANDLARLYYGCPLFKKYCQHNLLRDNYNEEENLKYCREYIYRAARTFILRYLLRYFSLAFILILCTSPCFIKLIRSGFIQYLDAYFLLSFSNNCFSSLVKIKIFIKEFFKNHIKNRLKKSVFYRISEYLNQQVLSCLKEGLVDRLKLQDDRSPKSKLCNKVLSKKGIVSLKKKSYSLDYYVTLDNLYKSSQSLLYSEKIKGLNYFSTLTLGILKFKVPSFYAKQIRLGSTNKGLIGVAEALEDFVYEPIKVFSHKDINIILKDKLGIKQFFPEKLFNSLLKSFNNIFLEHTDKNRITYKLVTRSKLFNLYYG